MNTLMVRALIGTGLLTWLGCVQAQFAPRIVNQPTYIRSYLGQAYTIKIGCVPANNVSFAWKTLQENTRTTYYTTAPSLQLTNSGVQNSGLILVRASNPYGEAWSGLITNYVCQAAVWPKNHHIYERVHNSSGVSWLEASKMAQLWGGYLATITDSDERAFITNHFQLTGEGCLIGGYQKVAADGTPAQWAWVTGESFTGQFWTADEPNDTNDWPEDYLELQPDGSFAQVANNEADYYRVPRVFDFLVEYPSISLKVNIVIDPTTQTSTPVVEWIAEANVNYRLESCAGLNDPVWSTLQSVRVSASTPYRWTDWTAQQQDHRIYRVVCPTDGDL